MQERLAVKGEENRLKGAGSGRCLRIRSARHVFPSPPYTLAKYFANSLYEGCRRDAGGFCGQSVKIRRTGRGTIEATACGIVPGLRGLELQTNAITPHPVPPCAARGSCPLWTRIHRSAIDPPSIRHRPFATDSTA